MQNGENVEHVLQMFGNEHKEELEDGKVLLFSRNGIFQARFYKGERSYLYKSLKTHKLEEARKLATKFYYETEYKKTEGLPLQQKTQWRELKHLTPCKPCSDEVWLRIPAIVTGCAACKSCAAQIVGWVLRTAPNGAWRTAGLGCFGGPKGNSRRLGVGPPMPLS